MSTVAADKKKKSSYSPDDLMDIRGECVASTLAKANRIVSRIYEEAFRDENISSPQFALLVAIYISQQPTAGEIAEKLGADPSTVSRNTEVLLRRELIRVEPGEDRRVRRYTLAEEGVATVQRCVPRWRTAQRTALRLIRRSDWSFVQKALQRLGEDG